MKEYELCTSAICEQEKQEVADEDADSDAASEEIEPSSDEDETFKKHGNWL